MITRFPKKAISPPWQGHIAQLEIPNIKKLQVKAFFLFKKYRYLIYIDIHHIKDPSTVQVICPVVVFC